MKKLFLLIMSLFLCFSTNVVNAANNLKSLKINGVTYNGVVLEEGIDLLSQEDWKWNPGSNTLTLDGYEGGSIEIVPIQSQDNINLFFKGNNEIYSETVDGDAYGIVFSGANAILTVRGAEGADLNISSVATGSGAAIGINVSSASALKLNSGSININSNAKGNDAKGISVKSGGSLSISNIVTLVISANGNNKNAYGIDSSKIELTTTKNLEIEATATGKSQACTTNPTYDKEKYEVTGVYSGDTYWAEFNTKIPVSITGVTVPSKEYDGLPAAPQGVLSFVVKKTQEKITFEEKDISVKYTGRSGNKTYNAKVPPTDAGSYKAIFSIRDNNDTYSGKLICEFEIYQVDSKIQLENLIQCEKELKPIKYTIEPEITNGKVRIVYYINGRSTSKMPAEPGCYKIRLEVKDDKMVKDTVVDDVLNILTKKEYKEYLNFSTDLNNRWMKASDWAIEELDKALKNHLVPDALKEKDFTQAITREEFAAVAVKIYEKISNKKAVLPEVNPFTDTANEEVLKAYALGITTGTSSTTFEPNFKISREQMATMMARALNKIGINTNINIYDVSKFGDHDLMKDWSLNAIYYMAQNGIIKGVERNHFDPTGKATREQALMISYRILEFIENK